MCIFCQGLCFSPASPLFCLATAVPVHSLSASLQCPQLVVAIRTSCLFFHVTSDRRVLSQVISRAMMFTILGMNLRYQPTKLRNLLEHCLKVMEMLLLGYEKYNVIFWGTCFTKVHCTELCYDRNILQLQSALFDEALSPSHIPTTD